jgi:hypothetical protein
LNSPSSCWWSGQSEFWTIYSTSASYSNACWWYTVLLSPFPPREWKQTTYFEVRWLVPVWCTGLSQSQKISLFFFQISCCFS